MDSKKQYDIGIYGVWYGYNYGSISTYYALNNVVRDMGYSTVMIENPLKNEGADLSVLPESHPRRFAPKHYDISDLFRLDNMEEANKICKGFLLGSDQMWNYGLSRHYKQTYYLDFAADERVKVSYATSFGKEPYNGPKEDKPAIRENLNRFNAVSVRDDFSKRIAKKEFGVDAEQVLDPVFLCKKSAYEELIKEADELKADDYYFAYILDPNPEIGDSISKIMKDSGKKVIMIFDAPANAHEKFNDLKIPADNITCIEHPTVNTWLGYIKNAEYVITDSFHGACFSMIFEKPFVVMKNNKRGGGRFECLMETVDLRERMAIGPENISEVYLNNKDKEIDYKAVNKRIKDEADRCLDWLKKALDPVKDVNMSAPVVMKGLKKKQAARAELHPDIERCKMVAGLLRDYGVKHVVVSSGARDVSLVRLFEQNDCFVTYNVTDERSAAYYALGIATRLKEPVAITCTSGTAVSNYLPGITEAYHMQVPIAVISGDRYPYFMDQMEAQKIDHIGALKSVVKKSVDLSIGWDGMTQWDTRRKISEALLEMTHHGKGPVHINVPMNYLENNYPPKEAFKLSSYRHIDRISFGEDDKKWEESAAKLKKANRILLITGQMNPMDSEEKKYFDAFCEKYNCVVVTDHLSNVHNEYSINPFNLMRKTDRQYFIDNFMPDLVLYVGGKRVLNCPLQGKMRSIPRKFEFWRIDPDGKVADLYRTLTHVYETPVKEFFRYFSEVAGSIKNNKEYFNVWKEKHDKYSFEDYKAIDGFTSYYTIGKTMGLLPKNSLLHLGVGTSFNRAHYYDLDSSVTVYCNMGTNGIDGSASTFMGQACVSEEPCFLFIGDLSFFYDMNSVWNKPMTGNIRILVNNDCGAGFLRHFNTEGITQAHLTSVRGWVESLGFEYMEAETREQFDKNVERFVSNENVPMVLEAFVD